MSLNNEELRGNEKQVRILNNLMTIKTIQIRILKNLTTIKTIQIRILKKSDDNQNNPNKNETRVT